MKLKIPNLPELGRLAAAIRNVRWRDPLVQAWGLIGVIFLAGILVHYVRSRGWGEQKNTSWAAELLRQQDDGGWRPGVSLAGEGSAAVLNAPEGLDLRACAGAAAAEKSWQFLPGGIRRQIAALKLPVRTVEVFFSGTPGGDVGALDLYFAEVGGDADGTPASIVIGNGRRSRDGGVETTRRWSAESGGVETLRICLVGDSNVPTGSQWQALGEIINCVEARSGRVALVMHTPQAPGLLAHFD